jgi:hypothetical protein
VVREDPRAHPDRPAPYHTHVSCCWCFLTSVELSLHVDAQM